jgi:hypothetical protein
MSTAPKLKNKKHNRIKEFAMENETTRAKSLGIDAPSASRGANSLVEVSNEERHHLIATAAYYRAEQRRFDPGHEIEDWLNAESEIEQQLTQMGLNNRMNHI